MSFLSNHRKNEQKILPTPRMAEQMDFLWDYFSIYSSWTKSEDLKQLLLKEKKNIETGTYWFCPSNMLCSFEFARTV